MSDIYDAAEFRSVVRDVMERHWTPCGYTVPNPGRYPFQWLWDSCFHSLVWAELGDERSVEELTSVLRHQTDSGFVPHITYDADPARDAALWGRALTSTLTQPPMYGFAAAELVRKGFDVPREALDRCSAGLRFLLHGRDRIGGLVPVCHPWETGADDSPRWDHWFTPRWQYDLWRRRKGELVKSLVLSDDGASIANPEFHVASIGFNALVAFNARELADVTRDSALASDADELTERIDRRWCDELGTWTDIADGDPPSTRIRTLDALLPLLTVDRAWPDSIMSPDGFGTAFGPASVHRAEPVFDPSGYWRGSTWPQLLYLLAVAAGRRGRPDVRELLVDALQRGAARSGLAEHWHAQTGAGIGAAPQSWTGLAIVGVN